MQSSQRTNPFTWLWRYFRESREELQKVTWPSRAETVKYSLLVIAISLFVAGFFGGIDWLLDKGLAELIELSS